MKWLCRLRFISLLHIPTVAWAARLRGDADANSWDYMDAGKSWQQGTCAKTDGQSPVDFSTTSAVQPPDEDNFFFSYPAYEAPVMMVNEGRYLYTVFKNDDDKMGGISLGSTFPHHLTVSWEIYKMVIHTPSEHTYGGKQMPMEVQLFHRKTNAKLKNGEPEPADTAIAAVAFQESLDEASAFLRSLIDGGLPDQRGGTSIVNRAAPSQVRFSDLFEPVFGAQGEKAVFWEYSGSLTQPPCSEGIRWFVREQPLNAKKATLKYFFDVVRKASGGVKGNARELQVIGTRPVFPRSAENAVQLTVFNANEGEAFRNAVNSVEENQKAFADGLNKDAGGADEALKDGADTATVVSSSNKVKECLDRLATINSELETAKVTQTNACNEAEGHQAAKDGISGGPAQIEAASKGASAQTSCNDQSEVVQAKQGQMNEVKDECDKIKADVAKEAEEKKESGAKTEAPTVAASAAAPDDGAEAVSSTA